MMRFKKVLLLLLIFTISSMMFIIQYLTQVEDLIENQKHHHDFVQQEENKQQTCTNILETPKCKFLIEERHPVDIQMHDLYNNLAFDNRKGSVWEQGWDIQYKPERWTVEKKLKVFIVPHSHNDPGWKRTFDEYYYGTTMFILSKVIDGMKNDPNMKFIWAEISFFSKWYNNLAQYYKNNVKKLIEQKQLEFVTGGWVMNDEASSHWYSIIIQLTEGQTWLKENLNYTVKSSWSIDPFGLSPTMPYILKKSGFENLLIQRTHYEVKHYMAKQNSLEFRWRQFFDSGRDSELFTHMMPFNGYSISLSCGPDPVVCCQFDFRKLPRLLSGWRAKEMPGWLLSILRRFIPGYNQACPSRHQAKDITSENVDERASLIADQWRKKATLFKSNAVFIPLGDDFRWSSFDYDAQKENYDKLIKYINENPKYNMEVSYATLSEYFDAVRDEQHHDMANFPSLSGDFFTYADRDDNYWSGYYTSRPYHKRLDRTLMQIIRSAEIMHTWPTWSDDDQTNQKSFTLARQALSLFQHHDGITGTATDHVVIDYANKMMQAIEAAKSVIQHVVYRTLVTPILYTPNHSSNFNQFALIDPAKTHELEADKVPFVEFSEQKNTHRLVVHNSLSHDREDLIDLMVSTHLIVVIDSNGQEILSQVMPVFQWHEDPSSDNKLPKLVQNRYKLVFKVNIPALSLAAFQIQARKSVLDCKSTTFATTKVLGRKEFNFNYVDFPKPVEFQLNFGSHFKLLNDKYYFNDYGLMISKRLNYEFETNLRIRFFKYGVRYFNTRSGAYLFLPNGEATPLKLGQAQIVIIDGPLLSYVATHFPFALHETIITDDNKDTIEIRNTVDIRKMGNTEIVMRIGTQINSGSVFYTDLNGLQMIKRERFPKIPLQGNFYPLASAMFIEDSIMRFSVLSAQPLGGSSLRSGEIEIMQDRRLDQGDERGLGQGVQDNRPTLNIFRLELALKKFKPIFSTSNPTGYLTAQAHHNLQSILHPFDKLMYSGNDWGSMELNKTERMSMDPSIQIVALRDLPHLARPGEKTVGVIIHRTFFDDCGSGNDEIELNLKLILGLKSIEAIYKAPLTLLQREERLLSFQICPMDTQAFIIDL